MKLSIWSSYYIDFSPEDAILEIAKNGWQYTELSDEHGAMLLQRGSAEKVGAQFGRFALDHGVNPMQGHLWLGVPLCDPDEERIVSIMKNWLDLFCATGMKTGVLHCDAHSFPDGATTEEKAEKNVSVLRRLTEHLKGTDFTICLENLLVPKNCAPVVDSVEQIRRIIALHGGDHLGICLDTGHLNLTDRDQAGFIRKAGSQLKALHIADNDTSGDQHLMPFGKGNVDFTAVWKALKEIGYDGLYNLEIPGERLCPPEIRGWKLDYLKKSLEYLNESV